MIYLNNTEIQGFVNKAQNKIADLASLIVDRGGNVPSALYLLLELSDFIECLDDVYNDWSEEDTIKYIQVYNHRANLSSIAFLLMTGVEVNLITGGSGLSLPITTSNISDYISATNSLISKFPHNDLLVMQPVEGYQGYDIAERYHINKAMYDKLYSLTFPFVSPSVDITLVPSTIANQYGFYELGTTINSITLQGNISTGSGKSIIYYKYNKNGSVLSSPVTSPPTGLPVSYTDTNIKADTTYTFETSFEVGGIKSASKTVAFRQPMYYGTVIRNNASSVVPNTLTKIVRDKGSFSLSFTLPVGNTSLSGGNEKTAIVIFPASWGNPISAKVGVYEFITDWIFTTSTMLAADGITTFAIIKGVFKNTVEGVVEFNFNFN